MNTDSEPENSSGLASNGKSLGLSEDWSATIVGLLLLVSVLIACLATRPAQVDWNSSESLATEIRERESRLRSGDEAELSVSEKTALAKSRRKSILDKLGIAWNAPGQTLLAKIEPWSNNPLNGLKKRDKSSSLPASSTDTAYQWMALASTLMVLALIGGSAVVIKGLQLRQFLVAFPLVFLLTVLAYLLAAQEVIKNYNFEYPLWGLFVGMLLCNTVGTPKWLVPAVQGELFIKIGLILLGGEVLLSRLLALGLPGVFVSWVVTPIVLISTYAFGQRILKMPSRSLNMVISADMSVCGVSAAIATAAACKAKKEELSLAIGLSLAFTAVMMVVMPLFVKWIQLDPIIGGAWMGGTIDSTGAVVAAGESLGVVGSETAVTVKMIQNILIGVTAFGVAIYWTRWVEPLENTDGSVRSAVPKIALSEVWFRFPKFVLGFIAASALCSAISWGSFFGDSWIQTATLKITVPIRGWLFCLAFVCIGLSTNFRELAPYLRSGKPLLLYICGQTLNLVLTLVMAIIMFGWFYRWLTA